MKKLYLVIIMFFIMGSFEAKSEGMMFIEDEDSNKWDVYYVYYNDAKLYKAPGKMSFPKIISVLFAGHNEYTQVPVREVSDFYFRIRFAFFKDKVEPVSKIKFKDGRIMGVTKINISFKNVNIPGKSFKVKDGESTKIINVTKTDIRAIRLKSRHTGGAPEGSSESSESSKSPVLPRSSESLGPSKSSRSSEPSGISQSSESSRSSGSSVLPKQKEGMKRVKYPKGTMIIEEDSYAEKIYFIIDGKVKVYKRIKGEKTELGIMGLDDFFGEMSLFLRGKSNVSVETIEDCEMLVGDKGDFVNTMKYNPDKLIHFIAKMTKRLAASEEIISKSKGPVNGFKATHLLPYTEK